MFSFFLLFLLVGFGEGSMATECEKDEFRLRGNEDGNENKELSGVNKSEDTESAKLELVCVFGFFRHGDRAPVYNPSNLPLTPKGAILFCFM
jgi:hypothetical protein